MKIVILGPIRAGPYAVICVPSPVPDYQDREEDYREACKFLHPAIECADEIWVYSVKGIGEHTTRDIEYARAHGKTIRFIDGRSRDLALEDGRLVAGVQKVVKDYAAAHPSEITLPCEKHHRLPCRECGVGVRVSVCNWLRKSGRIMYCNNPSIAEAEGYKGPTGLCCQDPYDEKSCSLYGVCKDESKKTKAT